MRESAIERYLVQQVAKAGGKAYKWVSPGSPGVPDRIVMLKGQIRFVELKASWGKLRLTQQKRFAEIEIRSNQWVEIIKSKEEVDTFVREFLS